MVRIKKKIFVGVFLSLFLLLGIAGTSTSASLTLPNPTTDYGATLAAATGGYEYVAWAHDDFWSFGATFITTAQGIGLIPESYGNYAMTTGSGVLDIILMNQGGSANDYGFESAIKEPGNPPSPFIVTWGLGHNQQGNGNFTGPVTVGMVLDYLHSYNASNNIPVFGMDLQQSGNTPVGFVGHVYLADPISKLS